MLWNVISKCYQCKATLFKHILNPAGLFFFFCPSSRHCFKHHVCIYILGLQVWSVICLPGEIYDLFNVESQQQMFTHLQYVILGKTYSSLGLHLVPISSSENYIVWIQIKPFMSDRFNHCMWIISREPRPPALQIFHRKKHQPFQIPATLSTVHRHIFIFEKRKKDSVLFEMTWQEHKTDPASLRGVNGIYSVYFLHAVHINPQRCRYSAHITWNVSLCIGFPGKHTSRYISFRTPQESSNRVIVVKF